jgi:hypothetical protein
LRNQCRYRIQRNFQCSRKLIARPDLVGSIFPAGPTGTRTFILKKADNDAILQLSGKSTNAKSTGNVPFQEATRPAPACLCLPQIIALAPPSLKHDR